MQFPVGSLLWPNSVRNKTFASFVRNKSLLGYPMMHQYHRIHITVYSYYSTAWYPSYQQAILSNLLYNHILQYNYFDVLLHYIVWEVFLFILITLVRWKKHFLTRQLAAVSYARYLRLWRHGMYKVAPWAIYKWHSNDKVLYVKILRSTIRSQFYKVEPKDQLDKRVLFFTNEQRILCHHFDVDDLMTLVIHCDSSHDVFYEKCCVRHDEIKLYNHIARLSQVNPDYKVYSTEYVECLENSITEMLWCMTTTCMHLFLAPFPNHLPEPLPFPEITNTQIQPIQPPLPQSVSFRLQFSA